MESVSKITSFLAQCYGTDRPYIRHSLVKRLVFTDSIRILRDMADCYWLIDLIASYQHKLRNQPFQSWKLTVDLTQKNGVVVCTDGNNHELVRQEIDYTDFPLPEIELWCELGGYGTSAENWTEAMVLMIPSER